MGTGHAAPDPVRPKIAVTMAKAKILMEALPYLQEYRGKTVVIKYGGSAMNDEQLRASFAGDITLLSLVGIRPVVVHGGGPKITATLRRMGVESQWIDGLRVTDEDAIEIVQSVLAGIVNPDIVRLLIGHEAKAIGITGVDGGILRVRQKDQRLGFVGEIEAVETDVLERIVNAEFVPVVAPLGLGEDGRVYNINADTAAGAIAAALEAEKLVYLTDVEGVYGNHEEQSDLLKRMTLAEMKALLGSGKVQGGMLPKLTSCVAAMDAGVHRAHILDGRVQHAVLLEIFTPEGIGTMIHRFDDV
jgi:acetylglutamate kinase